ncbi:MAG: hypothetical protein HY886_06400 [Deltaproteobacteria bacterium]|nr:hypothetical protein [Deltaproteobacteria bacterium]
MKIITSIAVSLLLTLTAFSPAGASDLLVQAPILFPTQEQSDDAILTETNGVVEETRNTEIPAERIDEPTAATSVHGKVPELPSHTYMK